MKKMMMLAVLTLSASASAQAQGGLFETLRAALPQEVQTRVESLGQNLERLDTQVKQLFGMGQPAALPVQLYPTLPSGDCPAEATVTVQAWTMEAATGNMPKRRVLSIRDLRASAQGQQTELNTLSATLNPGQHELIVSCKLDGKTLIEATYLFDPAQVRGFVIGNSQLADQPDALWPQGIQSRPTPTEFIYR